MYCTKYNSSLDRQIQRAMANSGRHRQTRRHGCPSQHRRTPRRVCRASYTRSTPTRTDSSLASECWSARRNAARRSFRCRSCRTLSGCPRARHRTRRQRRRRTVLPHQEMLHLPRMLRICPVRHTRRTVGAMLQLRPCPAHQQNPSCPYRACCFSRPPLYV